MKQETYPSLEQARTYEQTYRCVPISRTVLADSFTPIQVLRILMGVSRHVFLLESL